jgi:hypothetical protein
MSRWDLGPTAAPAGDRRRFRGPVYFETSLVAMTAGILLVVWGALMVLYAGWTIWTLTTANAEVIRMLAVFSGDAEQQVADYRFFHWILLGAALLQVAVAFGIFFHKSWARWLSVLISAFALFVGIMFVWTYSPSGEFNVAWVLVYGFAMFGLAGHGEHFRAMRPW